MIKTKKKKGVLKRIIASLTVAVMAAAEFVSYVPAIHASAENIVGTDVLGHLSTNAPLWGNYNMTEQEDIQKIYLGSRDDDHVLFCIEPYTSLHYGDDYTQDMADNYWNNTLSADQRKAAGIVMYYGWYSHKSDAYYAATQLLLWEVIGFNTYYSGNYANTAPIRDAVTFGFNTSKRSGCDELVDYFTATSVSLSEVKTAYNKILENCKTHEELSKLTCSYASSADSVSHKRELVYSSADSRYECSFTLSSEQSSMWDRYNCTAAINSTTGLNAVKSGSKVTVYSSTPFAGNKTVKVASKTGGGNGVKIYARGSSYQTTIYGGSAYAPGSARYMTFYVDQNKIAGSIDIKKVFLTSDGSPVPENFYSKCSFRLKNSSGKYITLTQKSSSAGEYSYKGNTSSASGATVIKLGSSSKTAKIGDLPIGDYTVEEMLTGNIFKAAAVTKNANVKAASSVTVTFENTEMSGELEITKTADNGDLLEGVRFNVTGTSLSGRKVSLSGTTDKNGKLLFKKIPVGTYTVTEDAKSVTVGFLTADSQTVNITADDTARIKFINIEKTGNIRVNKTSEDGYNAQRKFRLTWTENGGSKSKTAQTNANGIAEFKDLFVYNRDESKIVYTISEKNVPIKYVVPADQTVTLTADATTDVTFENKLKKGSIKINKQSDDGDNGGRTFVVTGNGKSYTIKTSSSGIAQLNDIPVYDSSNNKIKYTISEKNVPIKYVVPADQTVTLTADATTEAVFNNILKKFTVEVVKTDAETGNAQGDGTLAGAVYGLYHDGELVDTYTTDENGYFRTKEYFCGNYTIKEIEPSEGYLLDNTEYDVGAEAKAYTVEHNAISKTVAEQPIKGNIAIVKHTDNGDTQIETPEVGAEFEIYLKSAGSYESAKETEKDYLTTDENGYAKSKDMPYGVYVVHQVKGADGSEKIADFEVVITENGRTYRYIINNKAFESYVKIVKADAETGKTIAYAGAEFEIYDSKGNKVSMTVTYPAFQVIDTFCTDSTGSLITPDVLPYGDYTLVEVTAPYGYVADSTPVPFTISEETAQTEQEIRIVRVVKSDVPQKGRITVQKTGEVFSTVTKQDNMYTPVFTSGNLAGAVFEIRAAEDIVTADGTVRLKKGDAAATLTTDRNGYAESGELYLGKYTVTELTAPFGYVLNTDIQTIELVYAGQEAAVADTLGTEFFNIYQSVIIRLAKIMEHDDLYNVGGKSDVKNVTFGLFAAEEIEAADGNKIPANGLVQVVSVGEDMTAEFNAKIPFGKYYVQEISTDEKYVISGEKYLVDFEYAGQDIQTVDIDCGTFKNALKRGSVHGKKLDENGEPLANAVFGIFHADCENFVADNAIATSTSDENGSFAFDNIPYGKYIVAEIAAPTGYVFSDKKYDVVIDEDGDAVEITAENKPMTLKISKHDVYGKELAGAQMQLIDSEGNTVDEWISDGTDHVVTKLPAGRYTLREVASPAGYVISTDIVFEIDVYNVVTVENVEALSVDKNGIPTITMVDDTTKVSISKQDITNGEELPGATLQIIDDNGEVVEEWISSDKPHLIEGKLIAGETYTLHEVIAPDGYVVATDIQFTVNEDGSVTEVTKDLSRRQGRRSSRWLRQKSCLSWQTAPWKWRKGRELPTVQGTIVACRGGKKTTALVDTGDVHTLMIGAAGVGKTAYFLYPNIEFACASGMSFLSTDTKGDVARNYGRIAREYYGYNVSVIDLRNPTRSDENNILHLVNKYMDIYLADKSDLSAKAKAERYAKITAKSIINIGGGDSVNYGQNAFFYDAAEGLLGSVILLLAEFGEKNERHIVSVFKLIQDLLARPPAKSAKDKPPMYFGKLMDMLPAEHKAKWLAGAALNSADQSMLSVMSTALSRLNSFLDSEMEQILCFGTSIDAEKFCNERSAIFVILPEEDQSKYFMASLLIGQLYREMLAAADDHGGSLEKRVMFYLDEFGTLPKIEGAEAMFSAGRSRKISIVAIIQSFAQLEQKYGKEGMEIITDNTQLTVFGGFAPNSKSAEVLSKSLGEYTVQSGSVSIGRDRSQSIQMIGRPLMTVDELKSMPKGQFIVMKTGAHPMISKLKLYFKWGIQFGKPLLLEDKGARAVAYAGRVGLMRSIASKHHKMNDGQNHTIKTDIDMIGDDAYDNTTADI